MLSNLHTYCLPSSKLLSPKNVVFAKGATCLDAESVLSQNRTVPKIIGRSEKQVLGCFSARNLTSSCTFYSCLVASHSHFTETCTLMSIIYTIVYAIIFS